VAVWGGVRVPGAGWRSGLASTHPAPRQRAGGCHDHVSGTGLVQFGQAAAPGPGPVAGGAVIAVVGGDRVDPVTLTGAEPDQAGPVPQQLRQDRRIDLVFSRA
jgi:hypothetical protein